MWPRETSTFKLGDLAVFDLLQFHIVLPVLAQHPVMVLALSLVLVLQLVELLLQVIVLVLNSRHTKKRKKIKKKTTVWLIILETLCSLSYKGE